MCDVVESYSCVEGVRLMSFVGDHTLDGFIGGPLQNVKIKLRDIPKLGFLTTDNPPRGELCFKGSCLGQYFKTKKIQDNGWI